MLAGCAAPALQALCALWYNYAHTEVRLSAAPAGSIHDREALMKRKLNCWEFKNCGREPGGSRTSDLGICPATQEHRLEGAHHGRNAGRACWVIAGTLCQGEVQGTFAQKYKNCEICDFYKVVKKEEFPNFTLSALLMKKLKD